MNITSSHAFRALCCWGISLPGISLEQTKRSCTMCALEHTDTIPWLHLKHSQHAARAQRQPLGIQQHPNSSTIAHACVY